MSYIGNSPAQGSITGGNIVDGSIESIDLATLTNIDINSGSIDGTIIGATTTAAGSFTTLQADTSLNVDGTVTADAITVDAAGDVAFGTKFFWDASAESLGIGTSSPIADANKTVVNAEGAWGGQFTSSVSGVTHAEFGSDNYSSGLGARIESKDGIVFKYNGGTEGMRLDSSGNLLVGKTTTDANTEGVMLIPDGYIYATQAGTAGYFNRVSSDGDIVQFRKDNTAVGSIGTEDHTGFSTAYIEGAANSSGLFFGNQEILPSRNAALTDAAMDIGDGNYRFKDLYLSGGVYLGGTDAAHKLDDYEEGTWTPTSNTTSSVTGTWSVENATYTKIGNTVTLQVTFTGTNIGFTSVIGYYSWGNLPFTPTGEWHSGSWCAATVATGLGGSTYVSNVGNVIWLMAPSNTNTGDRIVATCTYKTNS